MLGEEREKESALYREVCDFWKKAQALSHVENYPDAELITVSDGLQTFYNRVLASKSEFKNTWEFKDAIKILEGMNGSVNIEIQRRRKKEEPSIDDTRKGVISSSLHRVTNGRLGR